MTKTKHDKVDDVNRCSVVDEDQGRGEQSTEDVL